MPVSQWTTSDRRGERRQSDPRGDESRRAAGAHRACESQVGGGGFAAITSRAASVFPLRVLPALSESEPYSQIVNHRDRPF